MPGTGRKKSRSKNPLVTHERNPVKYADQIAQFHTIEGALRIAAACRTSCERVIAQGDYLHGTSAQTHSSLGHWKTVVGYLKNKLEKRNVNKG